MRLILLVVSFALISFALMAEEPPNQWGASAERFFLPLTYPDHDPEDFGGSPDPKNKALAKRFRPHVFIAPGGLRPIDFYADYLPRCVLKDDRKGGAVVNRNPTRQDLKRAERVYGLHLDYTGPDRLDGDPVAYARVYRESVRLLSRSVAVEIDFTFIKYNFVFLHSGLPARLPLYKRLLARLAGDTEQWHELDIHGAVVMALVGEGNGLKPVALLLGQHNNYRTYLFGRDIPNPEEGRAQVSFALRSNEPYPLPHGAEPAERRAAGNPADFAYAITGKGWALTSGIDLVFGPESGAVEIKYRIELLSYRDPLYVSWIPLGDRLKIFGFFDTFYREGPPGMDLYTWPELKEYGKIMQFWFVDDGDEKAAELFDRYLTDFNRARLSPILKYNSRRFSEEFFRLHPEME